MRASSPRRAGRLAARHDVLHGVEHAPVAGAAAQVAAERLARFEFGRGVVALEQVVHGHRHAGDAEAALHGAALGERALDVGGAVGGKPLDGTDLAPGGGRAGTRKEAQPPVHLDVRAPHSPCEQPSSPGEPEPFAQHVQQRLPDPGPVTGRSAPFTRNTYEARGVRGRGGGATTGSGAGSVTIPGSAVASGAG